MKHTSRVVIGEPIDLFPEASTKALTMKSPVRLAADLPQKPHAPSPADVAKMKKLADALGVDESNHDEIRKAVEDLLRPFAKATATDAQALRSMTAGEVVAARDARCSPADFVAARAFMNGGKR